MQEALDMSWDLALGIFEEGPAEDLLQSENIFSGEAKLKQNWLDAVIPLLEKSNLTVPDKSTWAPKYGGRTGKHTPHLQPLLSEMTEVYAIDPSADW
jgi:ring-1,2-phenylacetyl-CoA epoxidase subunit PaaC